MESQFPSDTDYTNYRAELPIWLNDYWREEEQKRNRDSGQGTPLLGHELMGDSGAGFDPETFNLGLIKDRIKSRRLD